MSLDERHSGPFEPQTLRVAVTLFSALVLVLAVSVIRVPRIRPDVVTLVVVFLALEHELIRGLWLSAAVGYLSDLFAGTGPGLNAVAAVGVYLILRLFVTRLVGGRFFMITLLSLISCVLAVVLRFVVEFTIGPGQATWSGMAPATFWIGAGAVVLGYPVYRSLKALDQRFRPREEFNFGAGR